MGMERYVTEMGDHFLETSTKDIWQDMGKK